MRTTTLHPSLSLSLSLSLSARLIRRRQRVCVFFWRQFLPNRHSANIKLIQCRCRAAVLPQVENAGPDFVRDKSGPGRWPEKCSKLRNYCVSLLSVRDRFTQPPRSRYLTPPTFHYAGKVVFSCLVPSFQGYIFPNT
jgi:hypothetical protein